MGGVKVTYIETRFVTSDAAGFKDLVQRLTGRSPTAAGDAPAPAPAPAAAPRRPRAAGCERSAGAPAAAAGTRQGCYHTSASQPAARVVGDGRLAPPSLDESYGGGDFAAGLLYGGGASQDAQCGHGGYYSFSDYFPC